jgi:hypothetical protein
MSFTFKAEDVLKLKKLCHELHSKKGIDFSVSHIKAVAYDSAFSCPWETKYNRETLPAFSELNDKAREKVFCFLENCIKRPVEFIAMDRMGRYWRQTRYPHF